ncbi:MAG TPA: OmpA family protein [Flavipsychrobacter sp.]|nr:OmpA family protein [Flavipsychrobacter sp.]
MKKLALLSLTAITSFTGFAQTDSVVASALPVPVKSIFKGASSYRTWSVGVNLGFTTIGTLPGGINDFTQNSAGFGAGVYLQKDIYHFLSLRGDLAIGGFSGDNSRLQGNNTTRILDNYKYETKVQYAGSLMALINIANVNWLSEKNKINFYAGAGIGTAGYSVKANKTSDSTLESIKNGGTVSALFFPVSVGAKLKLSEIIALELGYRMNFVDGDNLDGTHYSTNQDKFSYTYLGLQLALGKKAKPHLSWHNPAKELYDQLEEQKRLLQTELEESRRLNTLVAAKLESFTKDTDADGVADFLDKCPGTPGNTRVDASGCELPDQTVTTTTRNTNTAATNSRNTNTPAITSGITDEDREILKEAQESLAFEQNRADIKPASYLALDKLALMLITKGYKLKLVGHTDNGGDDSYNMFFSRARAESVKSYLVNAGISSARIEAIGYGETQPIASNNTPEGRKKNNRVEMLLIEK